MSLASAVGSSIVRSVPTVVGLLIDKSGSMWPYQEIVISSLSQLVADQQKMKGAKASLLLSEFSHDYGKVLDKDFQDINKNKFYDYVPDGGTCLYDSIRDITEDMKKKIDGMEQKPKRVVVGIVTDGEDNGCKTSISDAKKTIEKMQKQGWEYLFFGALGNTENVAKGLGISADRSAMFGDNVKGGLNLISDKITQARRGKPLAITDKERAELALPSGTSEL